MLRESGLGIRAPRLFPNPDLRISIKDKRRQTMKRLSAIVMVLLLATVPLFGQKVSKAGTTAAPFLSIETGARGFGMGGAFVSVSDDISSMYWNPAGIARIHQTETSFNSTRWIADITNNYAALAIPLNQFGVLGVNAMFLSVDPMDVTTVSAPEGTGESFTMGSFAFGLAYAKQLTDRFSIGFNAKFIQERIYHSSAQGIAMDVGTLFNTQLEGLKIGMSISNYGTKMRMGGRDMLLQADIDASKKGNNENINANLQTDAYDLPLMFRVGLSMDILKGRYNSNLILSVDALHPNDNVETVNVGAEYTFKKMVSLRCGYQSLFEKDSEEGLCLGGGVVYTIFGQTTLHLDYAWGDFGVFNDTQKLSIGLSF
jgi:hypothetical protein